MARHRIETSIGIAADAGRVWAILTDFAAMPAWNPFITGISGDLEPGGRLSVDIKPPGGRGMRFKPTVLAAEPGRELRWRGRLLLPGLFDGEHYFVIEPLGPGRIRLTHGEVFSGLLVGLLGGTLSATEAGFRLMNEALKARAEQAPGPPSSDGRFLPR